MEPELTSTLTCPHLRHFSDVILAQARASLMTYKEVYSDLIYQVERIVRALLRGEVNIGT